MAQRGQWSLPEDVRRLWDRYGLGQVDETTRRVVTGAALLAVVEWALRAGQVFPLGALMWLPWGEGFQPWQPLTCYLVQGSDLLGLFISLLVLRFMLPTLQQLLPRRLLLQALGAAIAGGTVLALAVTLAGLGTGAVAGWGTLMFPAIALFGLIVPEGEVQLYFVLPVRARTLVWASLAIALITAFFSVVGRSSSLMAAHELGTWLGVYGWHQWRRRQQRPKGPAPRPPRQVRNFHVIDGGRNDDRNWH